MPPRTAAQQIFIRKPLSHLGKIRGFELSVNNGVCLGYVDTMCSSVLLQFMNVKQCHCVAV
ncbi:hypothetical protein GIB67_007937 [Kingdonia uniflora]|uniref:Uncharacterized protein n=1 Tax=Kingdonia uniflora TaxID=39325 RepID=A0A7J7L588_9MAGN|nr:hypothetical protein GIB67_007937 [Kingdonia uniflora]